MQWSHDADAKLFMHVLKIHDVKLNYSALAVAMGNDVTPKAITHRIAKLRSMADDASTPAAAASTGPNPAKRTPTTAPASKKPVATAANRTPVAAGTKRNAAGAAKNGAGNRNGNGKAAKDVNAVDDDEGEIVDVKTPAAKKVKTGDVDVKDGIAVFEDYTAGAGAGEDGGGVEYA